MWNVLVRVRLKSDMVHSKFSTVEGGFSLAWVGQLFVSNLHKLLVISSSWIHSLLFSSPISPLFSFLPPSSTCLFFPLGLCFPYWTYNPRKECHQNQNTNHTGSMQLVSYLLSSQYLLCLNITSYFCLGPELDEDIVATGATLLFLFLKHCFVASLLPCHKH